MKKIALALIASLALIGGCATMDPVTSGVTTALKNDEHVGKFDFQVENVEGTVTLNGIVNNEFQQYQAGAVAKKVEGVKKVDNKVKVAE
ncbi:MAG TPA: BON domain-containing protein [Rhizobacter sp.]|nr:BON domain-containing protein [Rhizobacter sp.]